mmetsp:Transcript_11065/g.39066  ORF Transcript_11065/g.39066 Transcript_11065/m.39066 type:complete len:301 (-) Transcript_11065:3151-4053(-)
MLPRRLQMPPAIGVPLRFFAAMRSAWAKPRGRQSWARQKVRRGGPRRRPRWPSGPQHAALRRCAAGLAPPWALSRVSAPQPAARGPPRPPRPSLGTGPRWHSATSVPPSASEAGRRTRGSAPMAAWPAPELGAPAAERMRPPSSRASAVASAASSACPQSRSWAAARPRSRRLGCRRRCPAGRGPQRGPSRCFAAPQQSCCCRPMHSGSCPEEAASAACEATPTRPRACPILKKLKFVHKPPPGCAMWRRCCSSSALLATPLTAKVVSAMTESIQVKAGQGELCRQQVQTLKPGCHWQQL